jgi:hypothetical protein
MNTAWKSAPRRIHTACTPHSPLCADRGPTARLREPRLDDADGIRAQLCRWAQLQLPAGRNTILDYYTDYVTTVLYYPSRVTRAALQWGAIPSPCRPRHTLLYYAITLLLYHSTTLPLYHSTPLPLLYICTTALLYD